MDGGLGETKKNLSLELINIKLYFAMTDQS